MHHQRRLRAPRAWAESSCPPAITPHGEEPQHSTMGMTTSARSDQSHQEATKKRPAWGHHLLAPTWPLLGNKQKQEEVEQAMASCHGLTHFLPLADGSSPPQNPQPSPLPAQAVPRHGSSCDGVRGQILGERKCPFLPRHHEMETTRRAAGEHPVLLPTEHTRPRQPPAGDEHPQGGPTAQGLPVPSTAGDIPLSHQSFIYTAASRLQLCTKPGKQHPAGGLDAWRGCVGAGGRGRWPWPRPCQEGMEEGGNGRRGDSSA